MTGKLLRYDNCVTWCVRIILGSTFIFSGFVKAVDPWGFLYKTKEYLAALSLDIWPNLLLVGVFILCAVEFMIGICLIMGCFRRSIAWLTLLTMCFMLPLTLWLAIDDPVKDCGCFGDAFKISNWTSFWKNVVLTAGAIWLVVFNRKAGWLVTPALQWLVLLSGSVYIIIIELFGYNSQPLIDFRNYKNRSPLIERIQPDNNEKYLFVYEKDGITKEFTEDEALPDETDGWKFIDRKVVEGTNSDLSDGNESRDFRIWSLDGEEDLTEDVISDTEKELIVMMPELKAVSPATTWKINSLYEWADIHDIIMIAVVSGSKKEIADWMDISMASYPVYTADDTQIKEVVRGNPGIVYLENGLIVWKSTLGALNIDDFMSPEISDDAKSFGIDNPRVLRNCTYIFIILMTVLILMSFVPRVKLMYFKSYPKHPTEDELGMTHEIHKDENS